MNLAPITIVGNLTVDPELTYTQQITFGLTHREISKKSRATTMLSHGVIWQKIRHGHWKRESGSLFLVAWNNAPMKTRMAISDQLSKSSQRKLGSRQNLSKQSLAVSVRPVNRTPHSNSRSVANSRLRRIPVPSSNQRNSAERVQ